MKCLSKILLIIVIISYSCSQDDTLIKEGVKDPKSEVIIGDERVEKILDEFGGVSGNNDIGKIINEFQSYNGNENFEETLSKFNFVPKGLDKDTSLSKYGFIIGDADVEKNLSKEQWTAIANNDPEAHDRWFKRAEAYILFNPGSINAAHFYKKLAFGSNYQGALGGGFNNFQWENLPNLIRIIKYGILGKLRNPSDHLVDRFYTIAIEFVIPIFIGSNILTNFFVDQYEDYLTDFSEGEKILSYMVIGSTLIISSDQQLVRRGFEALEYSVPKFKDCHSKYCNEVRAFAPFNELLYYLTMGEAAAMVGEKSKSEKYLKITEELAIENSWPYLQELQEYIPKIQEKFSKSTPVTYPIPSGFKKEQAFIFNPTFACHYCHANQTEIPDRYLPKDLSHFDSAKYFKEK